MKTHIALLRGINVGGKHRLPMKELVDILEKLGAQNVSTYIQSGNAVFQGLQGNPKRFAATLSAEINKRHGYEPGVLILTADAIARAMANNPFPEAETDPVSLHLGFLSSIPRTPDLRKLDSLRKSNERYLLSGALFYLHAPDGVGKSKLMANAEKLLGVPMTARNWRTVCAIRELAEQ